jgi:hypothetical protein
MNTQPSPFDSLKPGSTAILDSGNYGEERLSIVRVHRVTATMIVTQLDRPGCETLVTRYGKEDGIVKGETSGYGRRSRLLMPTPELVQRIEKANLVSKFTALKWKDLSLEQLRAVKNALSAPAP